MLTVIIPIGPGRNGREAAKSLPDAGLKDEDEVIFVGDGHLPSVAFDDSLSDRIKVTSIHPRAGANAARNHGIASAKNAIICFLDDDDSYAPGALESVRRQIQSNPSQSIWSADWLFRKKQYSIPTNRSSCLSEKQLRKRNIAGGCSSMIVRKSIFDHVGLFDENLPSMQDWDMWLRLAKHAPIHRIPHPLIHYNNESTHRISTSLPRKLSGLRMLLQKHAFNWPPRTVAFHESRIASIAYALGQESLSAVFRMHAPLASCYFSLMAIRYRFTKK
jgi:GT2 family glycosyltransferase